MNISVHQSMNECLTSNTPNKWMYNILVHPPIKAGRKEVFYLTMHSTHLVTVVWCQTCGNLRAVNNYCLKIKNILFPLLKFSCESMQLDCVKLSVLKNLLPTVLSHVGRMEMGFFNDALNTFLFTVTWHQTYGKGPLKIVRDETRCCHMDYSFWLAARVLLYAPSQTGKHILLSPDKVSPHPICRCCFYLFLCLYPLKVLACCPGHTSHQSGLGVYVS